MWEGSHTNLLSGKSMVIDMHDIDSPDKSALCFTVKIHVVSDVARHTRCGAKKRIIIIPAFLNS